MQAWENFLIAQEKELGAETAQKWLRSLKVQHFDACNLYLEAKDTFQANWFEEHMRAKVRRQLFNNNFHEIKVHIAIGEELSAVGPKKKKKAEQKSQPPAFVISPDELDPFATFENFIVDEANQIPFQFLSKAVGCDLNPIYLYGSQGVGKSHLLMAIASLFKQRGSRILFVRAETFTEHVVTAIRTGCMQEFRNTYRNADVLLIDDVHVFARRAATQEELFHTFNSLHMSGKQIILTANAPPHLLPSVEPRLISRFEWGIVLHIEKPQPPILRQILIDKAKFYKITLEEELIRFLLEHFHHAKALQAVLETLVLHSHLSQNNRWDLQKAKDRLKDLLEEEKKIALTPDKIIRSVAEFYGIRREDILGKSHSRECVLPRQTAMQLCRKELKMPYLKIGEVFSRDHSTVMTSIKQVEKKISEKDPEITSSLAEILRRLSS